MAKIASINSIQVRNNIHKTLTPPIKNINIPKVLNPKEIFPIFPTAMGANISTFLKDFRKTEEYNYYQLKTDKTTGEPYKPDIFQSAAAMNLFLGNDVLVTAPTGTGKTAIAEYIITKNFLDGKKTFYTTPLKALSNEKFAEFQKLYGKENVGLLTGDTKINIDAPIMVMTAEIYKNMVTADMFKDCNCQNEKHSMPKDLKTVIFDELQYLGDVDRGGVWEQSIMFTPKDVQILSLSATIGNNKEINQWISEVKGFKNTVVNPKDNYIPNINTVQKEAVLINVPSKNRHVPLNYELESIAADLRIPKAKSKHAKIEARKRAAHDTQTISAKPGEESYNFLTARLRKMDKLPAIYFIFSKKESHKLLKYFVENGEVLTNIDEREEIENILRRYKKEGVYLGESLDTTALLSGYATHNAGMLPSQKKLVEELFQKKLIKVVLATETLSAGINMPARTVVISSPRKPSSTSDAENDGKRFITPNEFHQMAGRAGRRGIDTEGFCYSLNCNEAQKNVYEKLIVSPANSLESNLDIDYAFIVNYMSAFKNNDDLNYIFGKSLFAHDFRGGLDKEKLSKIVDNIKLKQEILKDNYFVDENGEVLHKGKLIGKLNGYEQIPIINLIDEKVFEHLNPVQIAGIVGGLANIEHRDIDNYIDKGYDYELIDDSEFIITADKVISEVKDFEKYRDKLTPDQVLDIDYNAMAHLYAWADLNNNCAKSRKNWSTLYSGSLKYTIKDEGTLFKEIVSTIDMLKQLCEVADEGEKISITERDIQYYKDLKIKLMEAINLIQREPTDVSKI